MSTLLYSTANASRADLRAVATLAPMGRFHAPYPFADYVDDVTEALDRVGFEVLRDEYELTPDRGAFFGAMEIAPRASEPVALEGEYIARDEPDYSLLVGVRGSHDQRMPRGLVLGSHVMVCSNLAFSGDIGSLKTKQTKYLHRRLPRLINEIVAQIPDLAEAQARKFEAFKEYEFFGRFADAALVEIFRQGGLSASQLGKAVREYDRPTYAEHAEHGASAWRVFNAVTEALKPSGERVNHATIAQRTAIADRFLSNLVGVAA